jgi:hypothetical protein
MRLPAFRFPYSFVLSYFVIASASEAIQLLYRAALDCFVASLLAMTHGIVGCLTM